MKRDYFEVLVWLATIAVLALVTAAWIGMVADGPQAAPSTHIGAAVSVATGAAPAIADRPSRRSADDLLAAVDLFRCDMGPRAQPSPTLRVSTPPAPSSEQGIECPIDAQQVSHLKIFDRGNLPHIRNS
jgi:hypothetical protein